MSDAHRISNREPAARATEGGSGIEPAENPLVHTEESNVPCARRPRHPAVFVDSSALVALVDRDDASHRAAVDAYRGLVAAGYRLFTTNYVVAEAFDLLSTGVGPSVARQWLRDSKLAIYHADERDERKARKLVIQAEGKRGLSLTDAISVVVMERLDVADAFAVDPNFLADPA
ncbi:MAG: PIN domain-containing protein [Chloroflexota bacterium]|nr:PIN domain-containing protein [Chloroflexota bacterium]